MVAGFLLFSNWGWCWGWIAAHFRLQMRRRISAAAECTHQRGQEKPQDVLILPQGYCCSPPPMAALLSAPTFKSCLITHFPWAEKAALQVSSDSKYLKAPNNVSQDFRFPLFKYCLQICLSTKIVTLSGMFPSLLNFCYITIGKLEKLFWDLVMNLITFALCLHWRLPFYSFSSIYLLHCHRKNQQVLSNN